MDMTAVEFKKLFPSIAEHCGPLGLEDLLDAIEIRNVHSGEMVTADGELCDSLFLVADGNLISQITNEKETIRLGTHTKGECFGEVNILDPGPSTNTVIATEDSTLLILSYDTFHTLDKPHPNMTGNILRMLSSILVERCRLADRLLFSKYSYIEGVRDNDSRKKYSLIDWGRELLQKLHGHKEVQK